MRIGLEKIHLFSEISSHYYNFTLKNDELNKNINKYDIFKSKTFKEIEKEIVSEQKENIIFSELIILYNNISLSEVCTNFTFILQNEKSKKYISGILGLALQGSTNEKLKPFINQLKSLDIIDGYYFNFHFFNLENQIFKGINNSNLYKNYEGFLVIGNPPHEYAKRHYSDNKYFFHRAEAIDGKLEWNTEIKYIHIRYNKEYYNKDEFKNHPNLIQEQNSIVLLLRNQFIELNIDIQFIECTKYTWDILQQTFFHNYTENSKCIISKYDDYEVFNCDLNKFGLDDIHKFPEISLYEYGFSYEFIFNYNELFEVYNNKIYFLIIYKKGNKIWKCGKICFQKFQFVFNMDKKSIGIYQNQKKYELMTNYMKNPDKYVKNNKKDESNEIRNKNTNLAFLNVMWILALIMGVIIGIFFGIKFFTKNRKIRANELEEQFEYNSFKNTKNI
jgi:hypothetical protein